MAERIESVKRGDRLVFRMPDVPDQPVQITVTRAARDGSWADIVCTPVNGAPWRKRQQLPMPDNITRTDERPVWLLDVDGVLNARKPGWGAAPSKRQVWSKLVGREYTVHFSPLLMERIRQIHRAGLVDIRWSTTWCGDTEQIERAFCLPALPSEFDVPPSRFVADLKLDAARKVLAAGRRLVWTDDMEVPLPSWPLHEELSAGGRSLLIKPDERFGLQPEHIEAIEAWARESGGEAARVAPPKSTSDLGAVLREPEGGDRDG